jgi:hypothetical protein
VLDNDLVPEEFTGCGVCLCGHDEEIHAATVSIHGWLRETVTRWLPDTEVPLDDEPIEYLLIETSAA